MLVPMKPLTMPKLEIILFASSLLFACGENVTLTTQHPSENPQTTSILKSTTTRSTTEVIATKPATTAQSVKPSSITPSSSKSLPTSSSTSKPTSATPTAATGKRTLTESHFPIPFISFVVISITGVVLFFVYKRATDVRWR